MSKAAKQYPVVIRELSEAQGGGYFAEYPDLPDCMADGPTPEKGFSESRDALASYLASIKKYGNPLPSPAPRVWR